MRARPLLAVALLTASVANGCAAPAARSAPPKIAAPAAKPAKAADRVSQLGALLRNVPRPGPVLDALPAVARSALTARFASLDAQKKLDVSDEHGQLCESMPLLHLASGGNSPRALYALAATQAGPSELAGLLGGDAAGAASPAGARVAVVVELARRAALHFLRDRAADLPELKRADAPVYRLIERAALSADRRDLALAALEALQEVEPSPDNQLDLALARARELDANGARELLTSANADVKRPANPLKARRAARAVELAALLADPHDSSSLLLRSRAALHLGRLAELRALLPAHATEAESDLGLASALSAALLGSGSCIGVPPGVGTAELCASAFRESTEAKSALALLDRAWHSGRGRDEEAVEYYFAMSRLLPWMQPAAGVELLEGQAKLSHGAAELDTLASELDTAASVAPSLAGASLMLAAIGSFAAGPSASDEALFGKALALAKRGDRLSEAGVLAVAARLARRRDVAPLLDALPVSREPLPARAALDAWLAVTQGRRERLDMARSELAEVMTSATGSSLERARLVLTLAESDAALDGSERSLQLLSRVAGQLLSENIPPDLAFRAVLDSAGALSRGGRRDRALEITREAARAQVPAELEDLRDLWRLVKGYDAVLGHAGSASQLAAASKQLAELATPPLTPSTALWLELWSHELDARKAEAACPSGGAPCAAQARKLRRVSKQSLAARVGSQAAPLLERGFLPSGSVDLSFSFSAEDGLEPVVRFEPAFLAVELPKLETY